MLVFEVDSLNPYFTGLSILIIHSTIPLNRGWKGLNPYFTGLSILIKLEDNYHTMSELVSILILLDYLFLYVVSHTY